MVLFSVPAVIFQTIFHERIKNGSHEVWESEYATGEKRDLKYRCFLWGPIMIQVMIFGKVLIGVAHALRGQIFAKIIVEDKEVNKSVIGYNICGGIRAPSPNVSRRKETTSIRFCELRRRHY